MHVFVQVLHVEAVGVHSHTNPHTHTQNQFLDERDGERISTVQECASSSRTRSTWTCACCSSPTMFSPSR